MKTWKALTIMFIALTCALPASRGQDDDCYQELRARGLSLLNNKDYAPAINQFWAAFTCPGLPDDNDLSSLIQRAQNEWVNSLKTSVAQAQSAEKEARQARAEAEKAQALEKEARQLAETREKEAREKGLIAESLRLSLLSEKVRQEGRKTDALLLSFTALQLSNPDSFHNAWRALAEAAMDTLARPIFEPGDSILAVWPLQDEGAIAIQASGGAMVWLPDADKAVMLAGANNGSTQIALSEDGQAALAWSDDNAIGYWDSQGRQARFPSGHSEPIRAAAIIDGHQYIVSCSRDNSCRITGPDGQLQVILKGHEGNIYQALYSTASQRLLTRSSDGAARIWSLDGQCLATLGDGEPYLYDAAFSPDGRMAATAGASGTTCLWNLEGELLARCRGPRGPVKEVAFFPDGQQLITRYLEEAQIWKTDGALIATLRHEGRLSAFRLSKDGQTALSWGMDGQCRLWDSQGRLIRKINTHRGPVTQALFSPDESLILTTSEDGAGKLWDRQGNLLLDWELASDAAPIAGFSPDGQYFLSAAKGKPGLLRCPLPGQVYQELLRQVKQHQEKVGALGEEFEIQYMKEVHGH